MKVDFSLPVFFGIDYSTGKKDCIVKVLRNLDREQYVRHTLKVRVDFEPTPTGRKKRQATNATTYIFSEFCVSACFVRACIFTYCISWFLHPKLGSFYLHSKN